MDLVEWERVIRSLLQGDIKIDRKIIKAQKTSGVIYLPKKFVGKEALVIIQNENQRANTSG
jgi:putative transposon-encoded protein